jgi:hypothetical protein
MFVYDDNFLTDEELLEIEKTYFSHQLSWTYFPATLSEPGYRNNFYFGPHIVDFPNVKDFPYFSSCPIGSTEIDHKLSPKFVSIIDKFCEKNKISYSKVIRLKLNITPRSDYNNHTYPHVDNLKDHYVFLYYVNDSDGDTFIFNEKANKLKIFKHDELTLMKKITPKKGAAILMDGKYFHAISAPNKNNLRCVINANLEF